MKTRSFERKWKFKKNAHKNYSDLIKRDKKMSVKNDVKKKNLVNILLNSTYYELFYV